MYFFHTIDGEIANIRSIKFSQLNAVAIFTYSHCKINEKYGVGSSEIPTEHLK